MISVHHSLAIFRFMRVGGRNRRKLGSRRNHSYNVRSIKVRLSSLSLLLPDKLVANWQQIGDNVSAHVRSQCTSQQWSTVLALAWSCKLQSCLHLWWEVTKNGKWLKMRNVFAWDQRLQELGTPTTALKAVVGVPGEGKFHLFLVWCHFSAMNIP